MPSLSKLLSKKVSIQPTFQDFDTELGDAAITGPCNLTQPHKRTTSGGRNPGDDFAKEVLGEPRPSWSADSNSDRRTSHGSNGSDQSDGVNSLSSKASITITVPLPWRSKRSQSQSRGAVSRQRAHSERAARPGTAGNDTAYKSAAGSLHGLHGQLSDHESATVSSTCTTTTSNLVRVRSLTNSSRSAPFAKVGDAADTNPLFAHPPNTMHRHGAGFDRKGGPLMAGTKQLSPVTETFTDNHSRTVAPSAQVAATTTNSGTGAIPVHTYHSMNQVAVAPLPNMRLGEVLGATTGISNATMSPQSAQALSATSIDSFGSSFISPASPGLSSTSFMRAQSNKSSSPGAGISASAYKARQQEFNHHRSASNTGYATRDAEARIPRPERMTRDDNDAEEDGEENAVRDDTRSVRSSFLSSPEVSPGMNSSLSSFERSPEECRGRTRAFSPTTQAQHKQTTNDIYDDMRNDMRYVAREVSQDAVRRRKPSITKPHSEYRSRTESTTGPVAHDSRAHRQKKKQMDHPNVSAAKYRHELVPSHDDLW